MQVAKQEQAEAMITPQPVKKGRDSKSSLSEAKDTMAAAPSLARSRTAAESYREETEDFDQPPSVPEEMLDESFQVEVAPLQSIFINEDQVIIFRRIMINNQIYRQGFILKTNSFLKHLAETYFMQQPMARYTNLRLAVRDQGRETRNIEAGVSTNGPKFVLKRTFPSPFSFLYVTLTCDQILI